MSKHIFITGTNTDVGKTFIGIKLIKHLMKVGYLAFKPIETGCTKRGNLLIPSDSTKYYSALNDKLSLDKINPYRFIEPISPYLAIKREKKRVYLKNYICKLQDLRSSSILVEGAGGAFSPLALDGLNIDLMKLIKSFNILVVKDELGCISSTISNIYAFEKYKTRLDLIILNTNKKNKMANLSEIKKYTDIPVLNYINASSTKKIFMEICRLLKLSNRGV
tara:strand:- start:6 stop:668 length:663 start_codon:yes stop_codon:yes gene_type:complete